MKRIELEDSEVETVCNLIVTAMATAGVNVEVVSRTALPLLDKIRSAQESPPEKKTTARGK